MHEQEKQMLLPVVDDPDTAPFFEGAGQGRLLIRVCDECGQSLHLPRVRCVACGSMQSSWHEVAGRGRVYSWSTLEHHINAAFEVPYTVVLVELEDRPEVRLLGHLPGRPRLQAGTQLRVRFDSVGDGVALPGWELDDAQAVDESWPAKDISDI